MSNIDDKKLADLRTYLLDGGKSKKTAVMAFLEADDISVVDEYFAELEVRYPADFGDEDDTAETEVKAPAPEPVVEKVAIKADTPPQYFIQEEQFLVELEVIQTKGSKTFFKKLEPKDLVTIRIKGVDITVDLIQLAKFPQDSPHGVQNSKLIELAELAR